MANDEDTQTYVNDSATSSPTHTPLAQSRSGPVHYEIVDCEGKTLGPFKTAAEAGAIAIALFGKDGDWDVQVVGS